MSAFSTAALANIDEGFDGISVNVASSVQVHSLVNNNDAWIARWEILEQAKTSIDVTYYSYDHDIYSMAFFGMLLKKAEEGVKIRIMANDLSTFATVSSTVHQELVKNSNIQFRYYNRTGVRFFKLFAGKTKEAISANHDKILIVDGKHIITGGRNIRNDYFADPNDLVTAWRDSDVYINSESAAKDILERAFLPEFLNSKFTKVIKYVEPYEDENDLSANVQSISPRDTLFAASDVMDQWLKKGYIEQNPGSSYDYRREMKKFSEQMKVFKKVAGWASVFSIFRGNEIGDVKILDSFSLVNKDVTKEIRKNEITPGIVKLIDSTESSIVIQNPYVVFTDEIFAAIKRAHDRGVEIVLHTNSPISTDSILTQAFFIDQWDRYRVELPKMRIFAFVGQRKMHSKVFVFDGKVSVIGSYNLDPLSQDINSEIVSVIRSEELSKKTLAAINSDIKDSVEMTQVSGEQLEKSSPMDLATKKQKAIIKNILKFKRYLKDFV